jgi:hypothetical protein
LKLYFYFSETFEVFSNLEGFRFKERVKTFEVWSMIIKGPRFNPKDLKGYRWPTFVVFSNLEGFRFKERVKTFEVQYSGF